MNARTPDRRTTSFGSTDISVHRNIGAMVCSVPLLALGCHAVVHAGSFLDFIPPALVAAARIH